MRHGGTRRALSALALALTATLGVGVSSAAAEAYGDYLTATKIRTGPSTNYTAVGVGYPGHGVVIDYAYSMAQNINGNRQWNHHTNLTTSKVGFSSDYYMDYEGWIWLYL